MNTAQPGQTTKTASPNHAEYRAEEFDVDLPIVVITGISGALGRRLVAAIAERGDWKVVGLDTAWFPAGVAKPRHFTVHRVDLR